MYPKAFYILPLLNFPSLIYSFPTPENLAKLPNGLHQALRDIKDKRLLFDSGEPIDVSGSHAFQPPNFEAGDQRGPCPGLNALANHGYLPHDGVAGALQVIQAANEVFGMGLDVITVLSVLGTVFVGNPISLDPGFSIDGPTEKVSNVLGNLLDTNLLGQPQGLRGSHNLIESDGSFTRDDLYSTGDAWTMNMTLFLDAYDGMADGVTFEQMGSIVAKRIEQSIASNPYFFSGPYTGMIGRNAGYLFASRLLSNHTPEHPDGIMTREVFKSFWAVTEDSTAPSGLSYQKGHERIPENWYRIPADYNLVNVNLDLIAWYAMYPTTLSIGGNMGKPNSFVGVDFSNITGGVLNAQTILKGNGLVCFVLEFVKLAAPNMLSSVFKTVQAPLEYLLSAVDSPLLSLDCPEFKDLTNGGIDILSKLSEYPGAAKTTHAI